MHYRPPLRTKVHNIFHPFDPLGYRLEPMINEEYVTIDPVQITRLNRLPKIPNLGIKSSIAGAKPLLQSFWQYVSSAVANNNNTKEAPPSPPSEEEDSSVEFEEDIVDQVFMGIKRKEEKIDKAPSPIHKRRRIIDSKDSLVSFTTIVSSSFETIKGKDGQSYPRTDYVLSENMIDAYASEWIVALKSHFRYWANR